jgi:hypothetical protein
LTEVSSHVRFLLPALGLGFETLGRKIETEFHVSGATLFLCLRAKTAPVKRLKEDLVALPNRVMISRRCAGQDLKRELFTSWRCYKGMVLGRLQIEGVGGLCMVMNL